MCCAPEAQIILTEPDRYNQLLEHISVHRYFMGIDQKREVSWEEAVCSWYDNVYLPLVKLIRSMACWNNFPGRTEADLYAWLIKHQEAMRLYHGGEYMTPQETVKDFLSKLPEARRG